MAYNILATAGQLNAGMVSAVVVPSLMRAAERANHLGTAVLACAETTLQADTDMLTAIAVQSGVAQRVFLHQPQSNLLYVGIGVVHEVRCDSAEHLNDKLSATLPWQVLEPDKLLWMGGITFPTHAGELWSSWPRGSFVLPQVVLTQQGHVSKVQIFLIVRPGATAQHLEGQFQDIWDSAVLSAIDKSQSLQEATGEVQNVAWTGKGSHDRVEWERIVERSSECIRQGKLDKVVLARRVDTRLEQEVNLEQALCELGQQYKESFTFAFWRDGDVFLGATPERLVGVQEGIVEIDCLAGTTARGDTPEEDQTLAQELLESSKNRREHEAVRSWILQRIADTVEDVQASATPVLRKLANVQHLHTPVIGRLKPGRSILHIVSNLHPSPAVAGVPQQDAIQWIREHEGMDRGWYAGAIGWCDGQNNGSFHVAIRSALVRGTTVSCFAGAGIMEDSVPALEWQETQLKLRPMRQALGLVGDEENG